MRFLKVIALVISLGGLVCFCPSCSFSPGKSVLACCGGPIEGINGIVLRVEGVKTREEANKIESALKQLPDVTEAHVYMGDKKVAVTLAYSTHEEVLIQCINKAGFNAFLPTNLNMKISLVSTDSSPESLRDSLNALPGVTVRNVDFEQKQLSIDIYKPWIKTAKRLINAIEDCGCQFCLPKETLVFKTEGASTVDAFDARAYVQLLFGVVSADLNPDNGLLKVVVYKELAVIEDIILTIKERCFTDAVLLSKR